jgi:hypothetical protein
MRFAILAAALAAPHATLFAQAAPDWRTAPLMAGNWGYTPSAAGSEAVFTDARATRRVVVRCSRATRLISIVVTNPAAAPSLQLTTTETARVLPAAFNPQGFQLTANLAAQDRLLDALAFSRGRFAVSVPGGATIVLPAWPEIARSIEDCRS